MDVTMESFSENESFHERPCRLRHSEYSCLIVSVRQPEEMVDPSSACIAYICSMQMRTLNTERLHKYTLKACVIKSQYVKKVLPPMSICVCVCVRVFVKVCVCARM